MDADKFAEANYAHVAELDEAINPSDRVYRNIVTSQHIKVRVSNRQPEPGMPKLGALIFVFTGSACSAAGAAEPHPRLEGRHAISAEHPVTIQQSDAPPPNLLAMFDEEGPKCAARTERAIEIERQAVALGERVAPPLPR